MANQLNLFGDDTHEYQISIIPSASFRYIMKQMQNVLLEINPDAKSENIEILITSIKLFEYEVENVLEKLSANIKTISRFNLAQFSTMTTNNQRGFCILLNNDDYKLRLVPAIIASLGTKNIRRTPIIPLISSFSPLNIRINKERLETTHSFEVRELIINRVDLNTVNQEIKRISLS